MSRTEGLADKRRIPGLSGALLACDAAIPGGAPAPIRKRSPAISVWFDTFSGQSGCLVPIGCARGPGTPRRRARRPRLVDRWATRAASRFGELAQAARLGQAVASVSDDPYDIPATSALIKFESVGRLGSVKEAARELMIRIGSERNSLKAFLGPAYAARAGRRGTGRA